MTVAVVMPIDTSPSAREEIEGNGEIDVPEANHKNTRQSHRPSQIAAILGEISNRVSPDSNGRFPCLRDNTLTGGYSAVLKFRPKKTRESKLRYSRSYKGAKKKKKKGGRKRREGDFTKVVSVWHLVLASLPIQFRLRVLESASSKHGWGPLLQKYQTLLEGRIQRQSPG